MPMNLFSQSLKIIILLSLSGLLSACQTGHSYSSRYQSGIPVDEKTRKAPKPIPSLKDKPNAPFQKDKIKFSQTHFKRLKTVVVRKGDTLYAISRRYGVTVRAMIQRNHLKPPYYLYPGQKLKRPITKIHRVLKSDTVYSLSRKYQVDMTSFALLNNLKKPYLLAIGQKLKVPGGLSTSRPARISSNSTHQDIGPPPPQSGKGFMWPVRGALLSSYGRKDKGYHNDGINIAAKYGGYIRAADSGVVVYAGDKMKGFGKLILIRHRNGWITAYAHNSSLLIKKGQVVKRGQAIARVGQSGGVSRPQLHFEMRKGARAVNPVPYLKG